MKGFLMISFSLFLILNYSSISAQINNNNSPISVTNLRTLQLSFADINDLSVNKLIPAAVEVKINPDLPVTDLYAKIIFDNFSNTSRLPRIGIQINQSKLSGILNYNSSEILLSAMPVKLLSVNKVAGIDEYSFLFDVIQHSFESFINPGDYRFSIIFSNTPQ
jgi:hypothetical protein